METHPMTQACEIGGCKSKGPDKTDVQFVQVYDPDLKMNTMSRPAWVCRNCRGFATNCGLEIRAEPAKV